MINTLFDMTTGALFITLFFSGLRRWESKITTFQCARTALCCTVPMLLIHLTQQQWTAGALSTVAALIATWFYLKTRPLPAWWDGQHERIDNTQEN